MFIYEHQSVLWHSIKQNLKNKNINYSTLVTGISNEILSRYFEILIRYIKMIKIEKTLRQIINYPQKSKAIEKSPEEYLRKAKEPSVIISRIKAKENNAIKINLPYE